MATKNAKYARAIAIYAQCGKCESDLVNEETGSLMIESGTPVVQCTVCGTVNKMPKRVQFRD